jgi:hypothetical protein
MAVRGSKKARSVQQEEKVAASYNGVRSRSSGAADNDQGDVRTPAQLFECKYTGGPEQDAARLADGKELKRSKLLRDFEKVALEAWQEGREPVVALREYAPESRLADPNGWVDFTVRLHHYDVHRDEIFAEALAPTFEDEAIA